MRGRLRWAWRADDIRPYGLVPGWVLQTPSVLTASGQDTCLACRLGRRFCLAAEAFTGDPRPQGRRLYTSADGFAATCLACRLGRRFCLAALSCPQKYGRSTHCRSHYSLFLHLSASLHRPLDALRCFAHRRPAPSRGRLYPLRLAYARHLSLGARQVNSLRRLRRHLPQ